MADKLVIGCGYLGERVARRWLEQGHRVHATTRRADRAEELRAAGLEPVRCDVVDPDTLAMLPEADTVLHCVGFDRAAGKSMRNVYVEGLVQLLQAGRHLGRRWEKFIHISSTSVYGQRAGGWVDETSPTEPVDESGQVVLAAQEALRQFRPDAIVLRFAGIYGPGRLLREQALRAGTPIAVDPNVWLNLIHVADGVAAVLAADERAAPGSTFNVCDNRPVTRREFYATLAALLGAPAPTFAATTAPDTANRRVLNRRLREELRLVLRYPTCEEGLRACLATM
jgi:nucleoside-diphosphate-sugar epimerase